jgi:NAD(P)-dependent dehydrogenase (short-subunit alcohol dehydrogenase family)
MKSKVAFITGGTSGIGRATAVAFARRGASVVVTGRRAPEGEETVKLITAAGAQGHFIQSDVTKEDDIRRAVEGTVARFGRIDYAFNNAGTEGPIGQPVSEQTEQNYRTVFDINVLGLMLSMKHEINAMLKTGGGAIVNNASVAGRIGMAGVGVYVASKHAVLGLTKCAALEVAKQNIRVNAVSPAVIQTEMFDRFAESLGGPQAVEYMTSLHPIGRIGQAHEVAEAVVWLCSDHASFIVGHDLLVDGGLTVP